jgi:hypothetical protein
LFLDLPQPQPGLLILRMHALPIIRSAPVLTVWGVGVQDRGPNMGPRLPEMG